MYRIYYIKNNYTFRHFILTIFRLINEKNLVSSYTRLMWVVYSGVVRGELGMRSRIFYSLSARSRTLFTSYVPTVHNPHN